MLAKKFKSPVARLILSLMLLFMGTVLANAEAGERLLIVGPNSSVEISIDLADTEETRRVGLMKRTYLGPMAGMLFDFKSEQLVAMWMKDTFISLDMLFVNNSGQIVFIKEDAQPGDLTTVQAGQPIRAVLEVVGGFVQKHKVQVGHRLVYTLFDK
ncbi:MAG: DUF192 domain-containing protein [Sneathiella sp.]|nr:DUF192 domain-containing protein [Sneathiella sp.]